ncbi:VRR-NUC domain-containing protein [Thiobacter aerophilum]|uniref:VRR-NUC domain-containing protein n=1 Tax=Thiobacter aerophilum TaxID=3121275 RepID=UPI003D2FD668
MTSISIAEYRSLTPPVRGHRQRKRRRRLPLEEAIQRACVEWARLQAPRYPLLAWLVHVPNGGIRPKGEAGKLKAMGVNPGLPDILIPRRSGPWAGLAVEIKSPTGKVSRSQAKWLDALAADGWFVAVARSLDEFRETCLCFLEP